MRELVVLFAQNLHAGVHVGAGGVDGRICILARTFCFQRNGVIVFRYQRIFIANGLEKYINAMGGLDVPEDLAVLEPSMCKNAIYSAEDVGELPHALEGIARIASKLKPGGKMFGTGENICCPVESVVDIVDGAARLGRFMNSTQVLPF